MFIFNSTTKTKLAQLVFLYCGEFIKIFRLVPKAYLPLQLFRHKFVRYVAFTQWRKSTQFRRICLFTLDSTQEKKYITDSQESSLQIYTQIYSLEDDGDIDIFKLVMKMRQ